MARLLRNEPRFDYSPFLRGSRDASTKGRSARKEVQEAVNETDDCDTPWSTFVPIVQECRLFPLLLSLLSPSLSLSATGLSTSLSFAWLFVSLKRDTVQIVTRHGFHFSSLLEHPLSAVVGENELGSISRWNRGRNIFPICFLLFSSLLFSHSLEISVKIPSLSGRLYRYDRGLFFIKGREFI